MGTMHAELAREGNNSLEQKYQAELVNAVKTGNIDSVVEVSIKCLLFYFFH